MKTTKKLSLILTTFCLASAVLFTSCRKKTETPDNDYTAATDNNMAEWAANDAITMGGQASESGSVSYKQGNDNSILATCASVTVNTTTKIITVNFSGGACSDGHIRSGTVQFDYSGSTAGAVYYRHPGFKLVVSTPGNTYYVDGNKVAITHTVTNTTAANFDPNTTDMTWSIAGNVTITKAGNGGTINWNCNRTKTLMNTQAMTYNGAAIAASYVDQNTVIDWAKAVISVSGTANGTTAKGESFTLSTTSPLVVNMNCTPDPNKPGRHPIVEGGIDFTPGSKSVRHIDFGSGTCDNNGTVSLNGNTYNWTFQH